MEGMAEEVVAEHDGRLIALQAVHRGALAAHLGLIQDVIVDKGGHVCQFHDDGGIGMGGAEFLPGPGGAQAGDQHQGRPQHFAAVAPDVFHQAIDAGQIAGEFRIEPLLDPAEFGGESLPDGGIGMLVDQKHALSQTEVQPPIRRTKGGSRREIVAFLGLLRRMRGGTSVAAGLPISTGDRGLG